MGGMSDRKGTFEVGFIVWDWVLMGRGTVVSSGHGEATAREARLLGE